RSGCGRGGGDGAVAPFVCSRGGSSRHPARRRLGRGKEEQRLRSAPAARAHRHVRPRRPAAARAAHGGLRQNGEPGDGAAARRRDSVGGNTLRASVLGANDGLCSNLSLVMGFAGASVSEHTVLLAGIAGLLAGACSMGLGEWVSVTSSRELSEREVKIEREELE